MLPDSPMTLNSSFSTAWYPGENVNNYSNIHLSYEGSLFSDFTFICQIEGALVFPPLVLKEDVINASILLGDLEFWAKGQPYCHGDRRVLLGWTTDRKTATLHEKGKLLLHVWITWKYDETRTNGEVKGVNLWQQRLCPDFGSWWRWNILCRFLVPLFFSAFCFVLWLNNPLWIRQICTLMRVRMMGMAVNRPAEPHAVTAVPSEEHVHNFAGSDSIFILTPRCWVNRHKSWMCRVKIQ